MKSELVFIEILFQEVGTPFTTSMQNCSKNHWGGLHGLHWYFRPFESSFLTKSLFSQQKQFSFYIFLTFKGKYFQIFNAGC